MLFLDIEEYAKKYGSTAVQANISIPAWLNTFAESQRINYSNLVTDALTERYHQGLRS
jgi:hypothetical protein